MGSLGFPDFYVPLERLWIHKYHIERSDGHDLRDRAKVEHGLVLEQPQVVQTIRSVSQNIHNEASDDPQRLPLVLGSVHFLHFLEPSVTVDAVFLPGPDLLGPEVSPLFSVLPVVPDDVGLLKEETHGVG